MGAWATMTAAWQRASGCILSAGVEDEFSPRDLKPWYALADWGQDTREPFVLPGLYGFRPRTPCLSSFFLQLQSVYN